MKGDEVTTAQNPKRLGEGQSIFYTMTGAKRNGATTFLSLYTTGPTLFIKQI